MEKTPQTSWISAARTCFYERHQLLVGCTVFRGRNVIFIHPGGTFVFGELGLWTFGLFYKRASRRLSGRALLAACCRSVWPAGGQHVLHTHGSGNKRLLPSLLFGLPASTSSSQPSLTSSRFPRLPPPNLRRAVSVIQSAEAQSL